MTVLPCPRAHAARGSCSFKCNLLKTMVAKSIASSKHFGPDSEPQELGIHHSLDARAKLSPINAYLKMTDKQVAELRAREAYLPAWDRGARDWPSVAGRTSNIITFRSIVASAE
jgi:hypothetical protein